MTHLRRTHTRRSFLRSSVMAGGALAAGCRTTLGPSSDVAPDFSIAFLSDPHVQAEKGAARGFAQAVSHALAQASPPERFITGGDLVFDILETDVQAADEQFDLFDAALSGVRVPVHHTIGNHDVLGVRESSGLDPSHPRYGKAYVLERLGMERTYHSFDHEGWHFVILDTIGIVGRNYRGWVDEEQIAWLADDLAAANRPTVVVGHIPLVSNWWEWNRGTEPPIPAGVTVVNAHEVISVLARHPVRLVLGGHLHVVERFQYKGIEFANLGAVSGNWWNGLRDGFEEGYSMLDFRGDQVSWRYVDYGWEVEG